MYSDEKIDSSEDTDKQIEISSKVQETEPLKQDMKKHNLKLHAKQCKYFDKILNDDSFASRRLIKLYKFRIGLPIDLTKRESKDQQKLLNVFSQKFKNLKM